MNPENNPTPGNFHCHLPDSESEELKLLKRAVMFSSNGIVIADARVSDIPLIFVNPAFEKLTGYPASECIGRNCRFLHREDRDQAGLDPVRKAIREIRECRVIIRNYRKDGSLFWNEFYMSPIFDDKKQLTHFIGVQNDVSDRIKLEETKEQFFRMASHDLKNPLTTIISTSSVIRNIATVGHTVTEELRTVLLNIYGQAKEMQGIIEDYLDFQMIEDGQIAIANEPFNLGQTLEESVSRNLDYANKKGIQLQFERDSAETMITGDATKCRQIALNFINNALKFSRTGTRVVARIRTEDKYVIVEIRDQGPGLNPDDMQKIFNRYARLSNRPTGGEKSSGLGLYICKELIRLQSGEIGVYNNPDQGATFWFKLPRTE